MRRRALANQVNYMCPRFPGWWSKFSTWWREKAGQRPSNVSLLSWLSRPCLLAGLRHSLSFIDGHVFQIAGADVFGARADELVVAVLFEDVAGPAGNSRNGKGRREEVERNAH